MKLDKLIQADARIEGFDDDLQEWLRRIPVISKKVPDTDKKVPFELLEQLLIKLEMKYPYRLQWISQSFIEDELPWYNVSIVDCRTHERIQTIYGLTLYELYGKSRKAGN